MARSQRLTEYRRKRAFDKTPEPRGGRGAPAGDRFVIQEHHARRLHWDLRLEHDGVLVSWALPRGVPDDPEQNRLAVHTEDHPLEYLAFEGEIPEGQYGAGHMSIWDRGVYDAEKFDDDKVVARFEGERMRGRYALFKTGKDWLIHRMDPPEDAGDPMPDGVTPMKATLSRMPPDEDNWAFEIKWDGVRTIAYGEPGRLRLVSRNGRDVTAQYPEVGGLSRELGARRVVLDGEIVAFEEGKPSFQRLQPRMHVQSESQIRRLQREVPVTYVVFDLLYLDGRSLLREAYEKRRELLENLELSGAAWQAPAYQRGDGSALLDATRNQGIEGVIAKRLDSSYQPGRRSRDWLKVKNVRRQEAVIGGWVPGQGRRSGELGALLVGYHDGGKLRYAGKVGTGFSQATLAMLRERLTPLATDRSPFAGRQPPKDSRFVRPELVCVVEFAEWTASGTLRHPSYEGLREDKPPEDVVREEPAPPPAPPGRGDGDVGEGDRARSGGLSEGVNEVEGRELKLSNLDKVLYPRTGTTKGAVVEYYRAAAPALLPHLAGRPVTLKRYPDGVDGAHFFEKQCPSWRPDWVTTASVWTEGRQRDIDFCVIDDLPTLLWAANLADLEMHTMLARAEDLARPTMLVFDLDPGPGVGFAECAEVAVWIHGLFDELGLSVLVKSSGSKGLHLHVPLNTDVSYDETKAFARAVAMLAEQDRPDHVVSTMTKEKRRGKVFIDWSQNTAHKTTVAPFSLRARERPTVAVPLDWPEVGAVVDGTASPDDLLFEADQVIEHLEERAGLFRPLLEQRQQLPRVNASDGAEEGE